MISNSAINVRYSFRIAIIFKIHKNVQVHWCLFTNAGLPYACITNFLRLQMIICFSLISRIIYQDCCYLRLLITILNQFHHKNQKFTVYELGCLQSSNNCNFMRHSREMGKSGFSKNSCVWIQNKTDI